MAEYLITWEIDIEANNPLEAAAQALRIQRDSTSIATVFKVINKNTEEESLIDLDI